MSHCGGGQGPSNLDALTAIANWDTQGRALTSLLTTAADRPGNVTATRPAFAYPYVAVQAAGGDPIQAASYTPQLSLQSPEAVSADVTPTTESQQPSGSCVLAAEWCQCLGR